MMEITVGPVQSIATKDDSLRVVPAVRPGGSKDRRKKKQDRRENARDGVFVSLSTWEREKRRRPGDRRKTVR